MYTPCILVAFWPFFNIYCCLSIKKKKVVLGFVANGELLYGGFLRFLVLWLCWLVMSINFMIEAFMVILIAELNE